MIFAYGNPPSDGTMVVTVSEFQIFTAAITPAQGGKKPPTWGNWRLQPTLKFEGAHYGSSVVGMSYAKLSLAVGSPVTDQTRLENADPLSIGDRVCITQADGNLIFAGYYTGAKLNIDKTGEALHYRVAGPEWIWGEHARAGVDQPLAGQIRRNADADDAFFKDTSGMTVTAQKDLHLFTSERMVFNPSGHKNMTAQDVTLTADKVKPVAQGRIWEIPDRRAIGSDTDLAALWTQVKAATTLETWFNDPTVTGITHPDWTNGPAADNQLGSVDVDGEGLWEGLRRVLAPDWHFFVDPRPQSPPRGKDWGPFTLHFFQRGVDPTGSPSANLVLNDLDTPMASATASVVKLEAAKSIDKVVNKVTIYGREATHVKLVYWGAQTQAVHDNGKPQSQVMLQHGWAKGDGNVSSDNLPDNGSGSLDPYQVSDIVTLTTIAACTSSVFVDDWTDSFCTNGKNFPANAEVFRLFTWNEGGEWPTSGTDPTKEPAYAPNDTAFNWFIPDLTGIADDPKRKGQYLRRRRRMLDTAYFDSSIDAWRRVPPALFLAGAPHSGKIEDAQWTRVPQTFWRLDHERCAVWIQAHDLSLWEPLGHDQDPTEATINDARSFATLLWTGNLLLMLEGTVLTDWALEAKADRQDTSGSPFIRTLVERREADYLKTTTFADSLGSPLGLPPQLADNFDDAVSIATQHRDAGQDQQTHCSILTAADWPIQKIGSIVEKIQGRVIFLTGGANHGGAGAQIVAAYLDPEAMKIELLTESLAMKMRDGDRLRRARRAKRRRKHRGGGQIFHPGGIPTPADLEAAGPAEE